jgi:hypothetical protein
MPCFRKSKGNAHIKKELKINHKINHAFLTSTY